jgi:hypothetical protein
MFCTQCGTNNAGNAQFCTQCGNTLAPYAATVVGALPITPGSVVTPHAAAAANPTVLAAATIFAAPARLRREGNRLIVPRDAQLPPYCVKCGQPAEKTISKNFGWHQQWLYLLIFLGVLLYVIVATIVMKRQRVNVPLCRAHAQRRVAMLWAGWLLMLGFIPLGILVGSMGGPGDDNSGWGVLVGFVTFIAACVCFAVGANLMRPREITDTQATFTGVSLIFLHYAEAQAVSQAATAGR